MATGSLARLIADLKGKGKTLNDIEMLAANQERPLSTTPENWF
jgi:hypothetical protein